MIAAALGFLKLLSPRAWLTIGAGIVLAGLLAWGVAWVRGKDHEISVVRSQRTSAVLLAVRGQNDLIMSRVNTAVLRTAIDRQNASLSAMGVERDRTVAALAAAAQRTRIATVARDRAVAALLAGRAGPDPCRSALDVARSLP